MTSARAAGFLAIIALAGLFASCADWVSLGPVVECGRPCKPPRGSACEGGIAQYNRIGECACGEAANCPGYLCEPSPPLDWCFIAQFNKNGECACSVPLEPNACGQPCSPAQASSQSPACEAGHFEYDGAGDCVCAPAVCPCGQPCLPFEGPTCLLLHQYNDSGHCVCAPVVCSSCEGNPCCEKTCGEPCELPACEDGETCMGQCDKANHCVSALPDCDPIPK
ncbi:MAG: hypothetical protein L6Q76_02335 [Polyangiaceae bacterium]|nr:hypothetical protein [Polyangiaceae bacterium]